MKNQPPAHIRTLGLLLAAAALPFTSLSAQTADTTAPVTIDIPPPATTTTEPATTVTTPEPTAEAVAESEPAGTEPDAAEPSATATTTTATARRAPSRTRTTARVPAPAPVTEAEVTPAPGLDPLPETALPVPAVTTPAPVPPVVEPPTIIDERSAFERALPWLILALIVAGGALFILGRRRRRREAVYYEESNERTYEAPAVTPSIVEEATPTAAAMAQPAPAETPAVSTLVRNANNAPYEPVEPAMEVAPAPQAEDAMPTVATAAASAGVVTAGPVAARAASVNPANLRLAVRPLRAGVSSDKAVVEFELMIENRGPGALRDLRISTWMFPAGSDAQSEAEQMLIVRPPAAALDEVGAGERQRIEASVTLPKSRISGDSLLPVVAAEARYRTEDGGERRTSARFAVGVPMDGELAYFDVQNPSGMHNNVEARLIDTSKS